MTTTSNAKDSVKAGARDAHDSKAVELGARAGLVSRGLLWLTIGLLAARIALGGGGKADKGGALAALRDQPLGEVLLVLLALGFAAHAVFRLLEGTVGRLDEEEGAKRLRKRAWSLCKVVVYGFFAASTVRFLVSGGGTSEDAKKPTARVMELTGGRYLVAAVGLGIVVAGLVMAWKGLTQDFTDDLHMPGGTMRTVVERTGQAGLTGRGLVYCLVGGFLLQAAVTFDPDKAKGLDASLKALADQPFGPVLLWFAVACLLAFAAWSFLEARYRDV